MDRQICELCMDYLFGLITKQQLKTAQPGRKQQIEQLLADGYFIKNCKLYVYGLTKGLELECDIRDCDKKVLKQIARTYDVHGCRALNMEQYAQLEQTVIKVLIPYIGKFVSKKMMFLIKSYGLSRHDLQGELLCKCLSTLARKYPYYESTLHAINTVKSSVHNAGIDLISQYTRQKNQRLLKNKDGTFEQRNIDYSSLVTVAAPEPFAMRHRDERASLEALQKRMNKRGALFITLAKGEYNKSFSDYLGLDNTIACEQNYRSYLKNIKEYLNVNNKQVEQWFCKLRPHLM